jgi:hypothetical protein
MLLKTNKLIYILFLTGFLSLIGCTSSENTAVSYSQINQPLNSIVMPDANQSCYYNNDHHYAVSSQCSEAYLSGDFITAYTEFLEEANKGNKLALHNLGHMTHKGRGVLQNYLKALQWWRKAALAGDFWAFCHLGEGFEKGEGVKQNVIIAHAFYNLCGALGIEDGLRKRLALEKMMSQEQIAVAQELAEDLNFQEELPIEEQKELLGT